ncbi:MAG TPA: alpha/beta hydrolase [Phaeodactylibacter sp.]|nr:alpha/beta hydrolase [Phaeodactylibacter sp.]
MRIVIVMPGLNRNADEYRDAWLELANEYRLLIIAPQFSTEYYPDSRCYNLGNMFDSDGKLIPEEKWSFSIIDPLFDFVKKNTKSKFSKYFLFGHSAGAQFVSRFMIFKPDNKVAVAITANAGWYTLLDNGMNFPYGLAQSPLHTFSLSLFQKKIIILLGEEDCHPDSPNLRRCPEADAQGLHRLERGFYFFNQSKLLAKKLKTPFVWKIKTVPNVGHDGALMAKTAAKLFFDDALFSF